MITSAARSRGYPLLGTSLNAPNAITDLPEPVEGRHIAKAPPLLGGNLRSDGSSGGGNLRRGPEILRRDVGHPTWAPLLGR